MWLKPSSTVVSGQALGAPSVWNYDRKVRATLDAAGLFASSVLWLCSTLRVAACINDGNMFLVFLNCGIFMVARMFFLTST